MHELSILFPFVNASNVSESCADAVSFPVIVVGFNRGDYVQFLSYRLRVSLKLQCHFFDV